MRNLNSKGLTMTEASFISNLAFQKADSILNENEAMSSTHECILFQDRVMDKQTKNPIIPELYQSNVLKVGKYISLVAYLRETIKLKAEAIKEVEKRTFNYPYPQPELETNVMTPLIPAYTEQDAINSLSDNEYKEYILSKAIASEIGKFIHKDGHLDKQRKAIFAKEKVTWLTKGTENYPVELVIDNSSEELLKVHEYLANYHRKAEKVVNYYEAKIKNLVTNENVLINIKNIEIKNENEVELRKVTDANDKLIKEYNHKTEVAKMEFQTRIEKEKQTIANLRIVVPKELQKLVDELLNEEDENEINKN
jgi:hypothetical protein